MAAIKQNDGLVVFVDGSNILRTRLSHENKHLISLGKVVCVCVYEITRHQAAGLVWRRDYNNWSHCMKLHCMNCVCSVRLWLQILQVRLFKLLQNVACENSGLKRPHILVPSFISSLCWFAHHAYSFSLESLHWAQILFLLCSFVLPFYFGMFFPWYVFRSE